MRPIHDLGRYTPSDNSFARRLRPGSHDHEIRPTSIGLVENRIRRVQDPGDDGRGGRRHPLRNALKLCIHGRYIRIVQRARKHFCRASSRDGRDVVEYDDMHSMEWLNYHHLFYFSIIAEEGGVAPAARKLRLTHSTLSTQLRALENHFGTPLFERRGKRLVLTPFGVDTASYAADIFRLGRELNDVAKGRARPGHASLGIGVVAERRIKHHALAALVATARAGLLAPTPSRRRIES